MRSYAIITGFGEINFVSQSKRPLTGKATVAVGACLAGLALLFSLFPQSACAQTPLPNGPTQGGTIAANGNTDSWGFSANAGDSVMIRVGSTNFTPHIQVF